MNKYDKTIIFILLNICRIISKYCKENKDAIIYTIEKEIEDMQEEKDN